MKMKSFIADKNRKLSKLALYHIDDLSYTAFMKALRKKDVKVNGKRVSEDVTLNVGDLVEVYYTPVITNNFDVIYVDENVLVVYKKSGCTSEKLYEDINAKYNNARFIHRLDRNTDGVMIFALNEQSETLLLDGFKNRTFIKKYHAVVKGVPKVKQAILTAYLVKDAESSTVKIFDRKVNGSVQIKTGYKVVETHGKTSLLEVELFTGKTHQIRAHLAYIGHPIIGDGKYGDFALNDSLNKKSQMLTAVSLELHFEKECLLSYLNGKIFTAKNIKG